MIEVFQYQKNKDYRELNDKQREFFDWLFSILLTLPEKQGRLDNAYLARFFRSKDGKSRSVYQISRYIKALSEAGLISTSIVTTWNEEQKRAISDRIILLSRENKMFKPLFEGSEQARSLAFQNIFKKVIVREQT